MDEVVALIRKKKLYHRACVTAQFLCILSLVWQGIRLRNIVNQKKNDEESGHDINLTEYGIHVGLFVSLLVFGSLKQLIVDPELLLQRYSYMNKIIFLDFLNFLLCTVLLVREVYPNETKLPAAIGLVSASFSLYTFGSLYKVFLQDQRLHNLIPPELEMLMNSRTKIVATAGFGAAQLLCIATLIYQGTQVQEVYHPSHYQSMGYNFTGPVDMTQFCLFITVIVMECLKQPTAWFALLRRNDAFMDIASLTDLLISVLCFALLFFFSHTPGISLPLGIMSAGFSLCTSGFFKRLIQERRC